jgi:AcrR family transcriptional regulator
VTPPRASKIDRQDSGSREQLLDAAERLMAEKGYAATPVSAICRAAGVPVTSLYWHFGSKDGLLASVMERGADRWFAALPRWEDLDGPEEQHAEALQAQGADAVAANPDFLRLFYTLAIEGRDDEAAAETVQRVRGHALTYFRSAIEHVLTPLCDADTAHAAAEDLARFAVAFSDGCFFALHLEPETTDLRQMYADLVTAIRALAPVAINRAAKTRRKESTP